MRYYNPNGQPTLDGDMDDGSAGAAFQPSFGNAPAGAPVVDTAFGGGGIIVPEFEDIIGQSPNANFAVDTSNSTVTTNSTTTTSTTTQIVNSSGSGLVFNNTFGSGATQAFINEVDAAENYLQSLFGNTCTVNCSFDVQSLDPKFSGENSFNPIVVSYSKFVNALKSHASTPTAVAAANALSNLSDPTGGRGVEVPVGEAQILGLASPDGVIDDTVILNSVYWTSSALQNNPGDAEAVIEHEVTEGIMGRIGSLGIADFAWAPMDFFRYTASGQRDFTGGQDGQPTYFSADGSNINTGLEFHNSVSTSGRFDGFDFADWDGVGADSNDHDPFGPGGPGAGDPGTLSATDIQILEALGWAPTANPAPATTAAVMITTQSSTGNYEIYDIGNNAILAAYPLAQIGSPWQAIHVGDFDLNDTSDLLLRNGSTGAFELYDVIGNNASGPVSLGTVGLEWAVLGFGDFSGNPGETDMLMRDSKTAALEVYNIRNNQITSATAMGAVGTEWQFLGVGDFSDKANETDLLMRDANNGALEVYNISKNTIVSATGMGAIGSEWSFIGVGDFSGNPGETDMLTRDVNNGALEVYNIQNDKVVSATTMGAIGLEWTVVGIGDFSGNPGETDMITRDSNNGAFEIYDINHDSVVSASFIGAVGLDWQTVGIAPYSSTATAAQAAATGETSGQEGGAPTSTNLAWFADSGANSGWSDSGTSWLHSIVAATNGLSAPAAQAGSFEPAEFGNAPSMIAGTLLQQRTA